MSNLHEKMQPSSIFKHLEGNKACMDACNKSCFEVIDSDTFPFRLKIKEAIHTDRMKPTINKQQKLLKMGILVRYACPPPPPPTLLLL